ncbi:hypothetical protein PTTW11_03242 [Pyrenophora teres f. teres]|uniref:Uncharacterized protein n=1 Tax=Pyrenophora teres f. teres TaxID=97479 RepID=A0A6S6VT24_9PLEO|nr:hypothetical protein PTTW11_03242 [Pyrenophora teres f. teres]
MRIELGAFPASRLFPTPILATTELINAWLRDSAHPETDVEAVFLHSRSSQRRRRPMAYGPSKRPSVDRDEPITPTQSANTPPPPGCQRDRRVREGRTARGATRSPEARNRHEPPLDLQQRKAFHSGAVWWSPCKLREARFRQLVKEKEKEKELLDKIELKEAKENNRIYQLKIKEAARAAREEAKKVRDEAKAVKAAELDAKRRDRDAAKAIQQPQSGKRKASKPAAKQQPKKRRVGGAGGGTLAEVAAPAPHQQPPDAAGPSILRQNIDRQSCRATSIDQYTGKSRDNSYCTWLRSLNFAVVAILVGVRHAIMGITRTDTLPAKPGMAHHESNAINESTRSDARSTQKTTVDYDGILPELA